MRKILFVIGIFLFNINVYANDINKITIDIYVDKNGNADITETWDVSASSGTEIYKGYKNIDEIDAKINNFKVSMDGKEFQSLSSWDIDASFKEKAYKSGINTLSDGVELCFGISEFGNHQYIMKYHIDNFVVSTADKDMIYWTLIDNDLSDKPDDFYVKVHSDFKYNDTDEVWGYGYEDGYAYVYDGYIEMTKEQGFERDEYVVLLAEFPLKTFNTSVTLDEDSTYYEEMAEEGSFRGESSWLDAVLPILFSLLPIFAAFIGIAVWASNQVYGSYKLNFGKKGRKLDKDVIEFRNIPCDGNIFKAYWIALQYGLTKNKNDFLGALILKWLKDGSVERIKIEKQGLKKESSAIKLVGLKEEIGIEKRLYDMMYQASGDGILETNEFKKWCKDHYSKIFSWFDDVIDYGTLQFIDEGLIIPNQNKKDKYDVDLKMKDIAHQMKGLKKYLKEFSSINEKESIEVKLWREYLIYAQIFGIADKVAKEFKRLYPELITEDGFDDFIFIYSLSNVGISSASNAKSRAEGYSAGGGGSSFGGGGGGSFGGGGGGGFR